MRMEIRRDDPVNADPVTSAAGGGRGSGRAAERAGVDGGCETGGRGLESLAAGRAGDEEDRAGEAVGEERQQDAVAGEEGQQRGGDGADEAEDHQPGRVAGGAVEGLWRSGS